MKKLITYFLVFLAITIVVIYFSTFIYTQEENGKLKTPLELVVIEGNNGWGYEIHNSGIILVKQEIIPVVPGKQYFKTKNDAKKIGVLVLNKLKINEKPIITLKDLEEMDIVYNR